MNNTVKKEMIITEIAEKADTTKVEVRKYFNLTFECITEALLQGKSVDIPGFGKFAVKEFHEKEGRNPKTGEKLVIPASKKIKFNPSSTLKEKVNSFVAEAATK